MTLPSLRGTVRGRVVTVGLACLGPATCNGTARLLVPRGATVRLRTGGGGGYGDPAERTAAAVHADVREGYISEQYARTHFPHVFEDDV